MIEIFDKKGFDVLVAWPNDSLRGADLRGANLKEANLVQYDLAGADLRDANLEGADLRLANLSGTDLTGANLLGTDLDGANLTDAKIMNLLSYEVSNKRFAGRGFEVHGSVRNDIAETIRLLRDAGRPGLGSVGTTKTV